MRKLFLGSALAVVLTFGAHGTSLASATAPVTPELRAQAAGTIQLMNDHELSNQGNGEDSGDDSNGNNSSDND
jgi:hypothetical protein